MRGPRHPVIPAQAGIQNCSEPLDARFRGHDKTNALASLLPLLLGAQEFDNRPDVPAKLIRRLAPFALRHRHVLALQERLRQRVGRGRFAQEPALAPLEITDQNSLARGRS